MVIVSNLWNTYQVYLNVCFKKKYCSLPMCSCVMFADIPNINTVHCIFIRARVCVFLLLLSSNYILPVADKLS